MMTKLIKGLALAGTLAVAAFGANAQNAGDEGVFHNKFGTGELWCVPIPADASDDWRRSMIWDAMVLGDHGFCDPNLEYLDRGTWGRSTLVTGVDGQGRRATFRFYTLNSQYAWAFGSANRLEKGGRAANFADVLGTSSFSENLCSSRAAVGIGAASYEGDVPSNTRLAGVRAGAIAQEINKVKGQCVAGAPSTYTLNLGPHERDNSVDTSAQRSVVLSLVESADEGVNLSEAMKNGLQNVELIEGFDISKYDLFDLNAAN